ncbi:calmodulin-binding transcription activator 5 [Morus notabilis]|uniref:calmodulin-binding transcription activator 5 n=1 Tax=Morus notabilis TaxID=981085 RepID=UPI000CED004B|nr:calmodulin-binding transcription activator 5 [Morus notabilis]XP_024019986.1 calmodulin-binding transcription activator 5 [Morus notabilis]
MERQLVGSEIHGFHTLQDLDFATIMEEATGRWLRPNEIHAILSNNKYFTIHVKPVNLPKSGSIVLFDRKMLRNFRKDGHNWKKKKDGKTVKEAHEHLKVGNEERIHVYYAHGQDNPTFVRRCYWLLDKSLEHIVLVHYRETQESQGSPFTPGNSNSSSTSDPSAPWIASDELDSRANNAFHVGGTDLLESRDNLTVRNHEQRLYDINTLEWDELLVANAPVNSAASKGGDKVPLFNQQNQGAGNGFFAGGTINSVTELSSFNNLMNPTAGNAHGNLLNDVYIPKMEGQSNSDSIGVGTGDSLDVLVDNGLHSQDSFGRWIENFMTEDPRSIEDPMLGTSISSVKESFVSPEMSHLQSPVPEQIFNIIDMSPEWGYSNEKTKILVTGFFHEQYQHLAKSNLLCVYGDASVSAEIVQVGVYRCLVSPHSPGSVNLFMSIDGQKPISQVLNFECRSPILSAPVVSSEEKYNWEEFRTQMRLARLLFSTSKSLNILSSKVSPNALKEAKKFADKTSHVSNTWEVFMKSIENSKIPFPQAKDNLFRLILRDRLKDWLLERITEGSKSTDFDIHGQGVIHLCAILGYTWAIHLFSLSGLSLDFRDKLGWTALHWAAYCGNEKMVGALLTAGAKPNLVTDPTSANPAGYTAGDIAYMRGYEGLAAYLSEKGLVEQFNDMSIAGNASGTIETSTNDIANNENLSEEQLYLKDTLAAYRTAADAAARIQLAFREHSLKLRTKAVEFSSPEEEARSIIAAMKIQHAFRNFDTRKKIVAAARIQYRFRTWKIRKDFLHTRRQVIKIQAAFRGYQVRRQYCKILWSVGVLEKAILRWRFKRRGFRGLQVNPTEAVSDQGRESDTEEDFYKTSQKQAEDRVERSVVRVQALFRSKKAQDEYQAMKLAHNRAKLEYDILDPDIDINS